MVEAGVFDTYKQYGGSYVSTSGWIEYVVDTLTVPRETRNDICLPVYKVWKKDGAGAAVEHYQLLLKTRQDQYDFSEYVLMSIGSKLYENEQYEDAEVFLMGSAEIYPQAEYGYYTYYLAAMSLQKMDRNEEAIARVRESLRLNEDFQGAISLLGELTATSEDK